MAASSQTQISAATALVQLLTEHPDLPPTEWSLTSVVPELRGFVYGGDMASLGAFADVVGGSVRAENTYEYRGETVRRHVLKAVWRDVPVVVVVALPVAAGQVAA
jgi:hypothetical protein